MKEERKDTKRKWIQKSILHCERGMFTLDALIAVSIVFITALTLSSAFHTALFYVDQSIHRDVAIQLAYQYTDASKQSHLRTSFRVNKTLNGILYTVVVSSGSTDLQLAGNVQGLVELHTKVMWTERNGNQKSLEADALDVDTSQADILDKASAQKG